MLPAGRSRVRVGLRQATVTGSNPYPDQPCRIRRAVEGGEVGVVVGGGGVGEGGGGPARSRTLRRGRRLLEKSDLKRARAELGQNSF